MPIEGAPAAVEFAEPVLQILLEDGPLLAINKPAGLLVQGVPEGIATLESQVKQYLKVKYNKPGNVYLGIPHRLDRPVSGVVVFARNSKAAARLAEQFRERRVRKTYWAVVEAAPQPAAATLLDWLLKQHDRAHVEVVAEGQPGAQQAVLHYRTLSTLNWCGATTPAALLEIELETGRMHQIRVQLASRGWSIVGDYQYGATCGLRDQQPGDSGCEPIALHACRLNLFHPVRYDELEIAAPLPGSWSQFGIAGQ